MLSRMVRPKEAREQKEKEEKKTRKQRDSEAGEHLIANNQETHALNARKEKKENIDSYFLL